jgi:hypothetical protein
MLNLPAGRQVSNVECSIANGALDEQGRWIVILHLAFSI